MARPSRFSPEVRERAVRMVFEHAQDHPSQWAAITSIAEKIGCAAETLRHWVRQAEQDHGRRPGLSSTAERSDGGVHRRPPGDVRGRADLRGPADRPIGVLRATGPDPGSPASARASPARRHPGGAHCPRLAGAPGGLRGPEDLEAAAPGRPRRGPLHGRTVDAAPRVGRGRARPGVPADDSPGHHDSPATGPGHAPVHRDPAESAVGGGSDLRGHLAGVRLRGLRHRRVLATHRRLAGVELAPERSGARCSGAGALRSPDRPVRPAGASQRSGRAARVQPVVATLPC
jgi:Transposase